MRFVCSFRSSGAAWPMAAWTLRRSSSASAVRPTPGACVWRTAAQAVGPTPGDAIETPHSNVSPSGRLLLRMRAIFADTTGRGVQRTTSWVVVRPSLGMNLRKGKK